MESSYVLSEKAIIFLDMDDDQKIVAQIKTKEGFEIKQIIDEFNQELLNYSIYKDHSEKNKDLREAILKRILLTNEVIRAIDEVKQELQDPENILKPWDESQH